jgi:ATP-dependent RNA helicase HelY
VQQCLAAGLRLNGPDEAAEVRAVAEEYTAGLAPDDLDVLGYWDWLDGLQRGVAAHHAGLIPTFKEAVEELFARGLVKAVFATETLALGINMPARSVVLERLVKFNGETHADVTPGEYTQLTGRAGRRGIDIEGHAVVLWSPGVDPEQVAGLASTRTYPLRSSFRPSYNMAVNLSRQLSRPQARQLLERSFAQFQADRAVVGLARQLDRNSEALAGYAESMHCHLGDFVEYAGLRRQLKDRESAMAREGAAQRRAAAEQSLERLRPGDVIRVPSGRRSGMAVVVDPGVHPARETRPLVVTEDRWAGRLSPVDFPTPVEPLARVKVPKHFDHRSPQARRDLASTLRNARPEDAEPGRRRGRSAAADDEQIARLRRELREHPCHRCPDREEHARWAERWSRLERDNDGLRHRVESRTHSIARTFDQVCALLTARGYLSGSGKDAGGVTDAGRQLARIWSESDLLVAECLRAGVWARLSAPELAAAVSALVYESRREAEAPVRLPEGQVRDAVEETRRLWTELEEDEQRHGLALTREPDPGFAWAAFRWARGQSLDRVLGSSAGAGQELSAGDFVRWCKQLLDLLDQIAAVGDAALAQTARAAIAAVRRGVVATAGTV